MKNLKKSAKISKFLRDLVYSVLFYTLVVMVINFFTDKKMNLDTFFVLLLSLIIGRVIKYIITKDLDENN